jgi:hypothetical protein
MTWQGLKPAFVASLQTFVVKRCQPSLPKSLILLNSTLLNLVCTPFSNRDKTIILLPSVNAPSKKLNNHLGLIQ